MTNEIFKEALSADLPDLWATDLMPEIRAAVSSSRRKVVVLDDDPTGTQTVHGIPVITEWSIPTLRAELMGDRTAFYILTNSRSLPPDAAHKLNTEIGHNLKVAAEKTGMPFAVVSRSDSTLRGHFPGEMDALTESLGHTVDGWIFCPFFQEGGRYTFGDTHYVQAGGRLVPAGDTEFAGDADFGYQSSNLPLWVEEKTAGRIKSADTISISIDDIRRGGPQRVKEVLLSVGGQRVCIVNAIDYRDLEVFVLGLLRAEALGKIFLYRTAASFVRVRSGINPRPLLAPSEMGVDENGGGLIIIGSYVPKTSRQLKALLQANPKIVREETSVKRLLDETEHYDECKRVAARIDDALLDGKDAVIYTNRRYVPATGTRTGLENGRIISSGLVSILRDIKSRPSYLIAKGGITSSDLATKGLGLRKALIMGQILPGIPVWRLGNETRWPGTAYIVFPGNVGDDNALAVIRERLAIAR
jgi:uncharacterized protein YgbK (DUF1537 family)